MVYAIARRLTGFRWSRENLRVGALFVASIGLVFVSFAFMPPAFALVAGALVTAVGSAWALHHLACLVPPDQLPRQVRSVAIWVASLGKQRK